MQAPPWHLLGSCVGRSGWRSAAHEPRARRKEWTPTQDWVRLVDLPTTPPNHAPQSIRASTWLRRQPNSHAWSPNDRTAGVQVEARSYHAEPTLPCVSERIRGPQEAPRPQSACLTQTRIGVHYLGTRHRPATALLTAGPHRGPAASVVIGIDLSTWPRTMIARTEGGRRRIGYRQIRAGYAQTCRNGPDTFTPMIPISGPQARRGATCAF